MRRDLAPSAWPNTVRNDWVLPLRLAAWQPIRTPCVGPTYSPWEAADTPEAAAALQARATSTGNVVPDGVVPSELPALLTAIGVPGGATTAAAAAVVVAQCRGAHQAQLLGARRNAAHLRTVGVPIANADGSPMQTSPCQCCNNRSTVLYLVRRAVGKHAASLVDKVRQKHLRGLVGDHGRTARHPTRVALRHMFEDNGIHACFSCASDAMAESYSHRPFGRSPAITDALRRQAAWAQRRATVDSATAPPLPPISAARASRQQHHPHGLLAAKLVGRLLLHSEQLAVIAEVMSDASRPDRPIVAWLLSADRVLDPERDVPSQCRPMPLAEAEAAADAYEKTADECDASARAADLLGSMVPAPRGSAAGSQLGGDDMDGIDDSANAAPDDDITGGAGSEAQAQNTAAAGGDAQAGSGEIRFAAGDGEMRGDAAPGGVSDEAVDSAAATLGGIQAAASSGEAASGSAIDAVGGKRMREEGGEDGGSESGAAGEGTHQGKTKSRRGKQKNFRARQADARQREKDGEVLDE